MTKDLKRLTPEREARIRERAAEREHYYDGDLSTLLDEIDRLRNGAQEYDELLRHFDKQVIELMERDERILELEQQLADLGPWTVKDLRQYAEDTVADFRSLRERLAEAERILWHCQRAAKRNPLDMDYESKAIEEYFAKHEE